MQRIFEKCDYDFEDKFNNFEKYVRRQSLSRFLARYELFKFVKNVKDSIIECGVHHGEGLFSWTKLSVTLEHFQIHRRIIGFDTFEYFCSIDSKDQSNQDDYWPGETSAVLEKFSNLNKLEVKHFDFVPKISHAIL